MAETIRISASERKELTTGENPSPPKYTYYALNNAVTYSHANHRPVVGELNKIYEEFRDQNPDGDFEDWKQYYFREHDGKERLYEATEKAFTKFLMIREAIEQIDREDVREFIEGIVLHGTYSGQSEHEAVVKKLLESRDECERLDNDEGPEGCEMRLGDQYISVQHGSVRDEELFSDRDDVVVIYFEENRNDNGLQVDVSEMNTSLDEYS